VEEGAPEWRRGRRRRMRRWRRGWRRGGGDESAEEGGR
jgi:hypothetical protein